MTTDSPDRSIVGSSGRQFSMQTSSPLHGGVPMKIRRNRHLSPAYSSHQRSCSFKTRTKPRDGEGEENQPRRHSMPVQQTPNLLSVSYNDLRECREEEEGLHRVRSFKTTSKGLVNDGDSFKSRSTNNIMSTGSTVTSDSNNPKEETRSILVRERFPSEASDESSTTPSCTSYTSQQSPSYFRVLMLGANGVGKTAITNQFMTSEYMGAYDTTIELYNDKTVSVLLDGEETTMEFLDFNDGEVPIEDLNIDAYVLAFSLTDQSTFQVARNIARRLRLDFGTDRTICLVGNKSDLVRKRQVTVDDAKRLATNYDCKYIEASVALNHNIDELLVGILKQIRLKLSLDVDIAVPQSPNKKPKDSNKTKGPKGLLTKLFKINNKYAKSCDNLYQL
ncbi:hypothetical protein ScPMuIL_001978 [Solemya velum]